MIGPQSKRPLPDEWQGAFSWGYRVVFSLPIIISEKEYNNLL